MSLGFVVIQNWYFFAHPLPPAVAIRAAGFDVAMAIREGQQVGLTGGVGIWLTPCALSRCGGNRLREAIALWHLYLWERPDLVYHLARKPVMFGSLAARLAGVPAQVKAVAGLGWLFISSGGAVRFARAALRLILARLLNRPCSLTIVQNPEDKPLLERSGVPATCSRLIRGAGVDVQLACPAVPPDEPVCIVLASRMLWDKGVGEFVEATRRLTAAGVDARVKLVGGPYPANPASVPESTLQSWHGQHGVACWGKRDDMPSVLQSPHIACLPSFCGEGLPKSLLEAAAFGLPIVTTDAPGFRDTVRDGINGLLVPVRDAAALSAALRALIDDADLRRRMGAQSRMWAETEFGLVTVIAQTLAVYREVCA